MTIRFTNIATRIINSFLSLLSKVAFNDMMVVSVPLPAIRGNAIGTTVPEGAPCSDLKNSIPRIISSPKIKITIEPATANDRMSTPSIFRNGFPIKKNNTINAPEISVTLHALIPPIFCLIDISIGTEPTISMTANNVKVSVRNSCKLNCMTVGFCKCSYLKIYFSLNKFSSSDRYSRQFLQRQSA
jgi:hypothetical protein